MSSTSSITFVREINLDASGYTRVTHLTFAVPLLGRSELIVTEHPLTSTVDVPTLQGAPQHRSNLFNLPSSQGALGPTGKGEPSRSEHPCEMSAREKKHISADHTDTLHNPVGAPNDLCW
jgi:hypothetical protein